MSGHHYISQHHLKRWTAFQRGDRHKKKCFVFNAIPGSSEYHLTKTDDILCRKGLFALRQGDLVDDGPEKNLMGELDREMTSLFSRLDRDPSVAPDGSNEKRLLAKMTVFGVFRNPKTMGEIGLGVAEHIDQHFKNGGAAIDASHLDRYMGDRIRKDARTGHA